MARLEEGEAERRGAFELAEKGRREELRGIGDSGDDERAPAHAEQVLERCRAGWEAFKLGADRLAEVEQLNDEGVEQDACGCSAREERGRSSAKILADVLEVVTELEQHSPIEGNLAFLRGEPATDEAGVSEDGCAALCATDTEDLIAAQGPCRGELGNALLLCLMDGEQ